VDRWEGALLALVVLIGLTLVPISLAIGSLTHARLAERAEREAAERVVVVATLTEDAPAASTDPSTEDGGGTSAVRAEWRAPDGPTRRGRVWADNGLLAGAKVHTWVDADGRVAGAPLTTSDALLWATMTGLGVFVGAAGLLALVQLGLHRVFDQRRLRAWTREWARVEPEWRRRHRPSR
jgi:hypothetical protein